MQFILLIIALIACKPNSSSSTNAGKQYTRSNTCSEHEGDLGWGCEVHKFRFDPSQEWHKSSFEVKEGRYYEISVRLSQDWSDAGVKSNLKGWTQYKTLSKVYSPMRRSKQIEFYQIAFCQDKSYDDCQALERRTTRFNPDFSGKLYFFVNDVSNFSFNNKGHANIEIKEVFH